MRANFTTRLSVTLALVSSVACLDVSQLIGAPCLAQSDCERLGVGEGRIEGQFPLTCAKSEYLDEFADPLWKNAEGWEERQTTIEEDVGLCADLSCRDDGDCHTCVPLPQAVQCNEEQHCECLSGDCGLDIFGSHGAVEEVTVMDASGNPFSVTTYLGSYCEVEMDCLFYTCPWIEPIGGQMHYTMQSLDAWGGSYETGVNYRWALREGEAYCDMSKHDRSDLGLCRPISTRGK